MQRTEGFFAPNVQGFLPGWLCVAESGRGLVQHKGLRTGPERRGLLLLAGVFLSINVGKAAGH